MRLKDVRTRYPKKATIIAGNPYGLPVGKVFLCARRKEGNASPYPLEVFSFAGDYRIYQLTDGEALLEEPEHD